MQEQKMDHYSQINLLNNFGTAKELIQDEQFLTNLISGTNDRHMMGALFDLVNDGIRSGEILPEDLALIRTGFLTDVVLNLPNAAKQQGRNLFPFEVGDKLNYISSIEDIETLNASYANPNLIDNMTKYPYSREINYWIESGTIYSLPVETQTKVATEFIKAGNIEKGTEILNIISSSLERKRQSEEKERLEQMGRTM